MLGPPRGLKRPGVCLHGDFDYFFGDRGRDRFAVFGQAGQITGNGITDVHERLGPRFALGDTTRQCRALGDKNAVLVLFDCDPVVYCANN
jgi:hypothetical protein